MFPNFRLQWFSKYSNIEAFSVRKIYKCYVDIWNFKQNYTIPINLKKQIKLTIVNYIQHFAFLAF